jgi:hypothetical protein
MRSDKNAKKIFRGGKIKVISDSPTPKSKENSDDDDIDKI